MISKIEQQFNAATKQSQLFFNRELSLLEFNKRVIAQAEDEKLPLLERLRYLCIGSSNLDEFFEIRVSSLHAKQSQDEQNNAHSALLHEIANKCHAIVDRQYQILNKKILPALAENGVHLLKFRDLNKEQAAWVKNHFETQIRPLLTPIVFDPAHPFPKVANKSLNFIVSLAGNDAFGRGSATAIVKAPRVLPRVIKLPDELSDNKGTCLTLLTSIIHGHLHELFPDRKVIACSQFRVTRDSDLWVDEEEVKNLKQALKLSLQNRHFSTAVRLEVSKNCPDDLAKFLLKEFKLDEDCVYRVDGPVNMVRLGQIFNYVQAPELYFQPYNASVHKDAVNNGALFETLKKKDILLHHPFQTFQTVIDFIQNAADDPDVLVIKQTIYRAGMTSKLMEALISAANKGKEVVVIVELKARFDEEQNIDWAQRLEQAGAQVVYGVMGLKTHAKLALVIRRENNTLRYYSHLGTGNYHPNTTKVYTDFGLLTANPDLTKEVNEVFLHLTSMTRPKTLSHLWLAPFTLHRHLIRAILNEVRIARQGRPARIVAKMNSLVDESVIKALYLASISGVKIELIVRGACALRPGVPGLSENIRVRSIIGRFLEHERIYYFRNDLKHDLYLSSADWMARNLFRRIEVAYPVTDLALKKRVIEEGLKFYLKDNTNAWELQSDGTYRRRKPRKKQEAFSAQLKLANMYEFDPQQTLLSTKPTPEQISALAANETAELIESTEKLISDDEKRQQALEMEKAQAQEKALDQDLTIEATPQAVADAS